MTLATPHPVLAWSDALALDLPPMDETHKEFVDLLAAVVQAPDAALLGAWRALIVHTDDHFAREDRWMHDTGFAPDNCHASQHQVILQIMREGEQRGCQGEWAVIRQMADELGQWFPLHAQSMDGALAQHLRSVAYDTATGQVHRPAALPEQAIGGCGGGTCADSEVDTQAHVPTLQAAL